MAVRRRRLFSLPITVAFVVVACVPVLERDSAVALFVRDVVRIDGDAGAQVPVDLAPPRGLLGTVLALVAVVGAGWIDVSPTGLATPDPASFADVAARCPPYASERFGVLRIAYADGEERVPLRLVCTGAPSDAPLTWAPPELTKPKYVVIDTEPIMTTYRLDPSRDYVVVMPAAPVRRAITLLGGRNVVLIGGEIAIPWQGAWPSISSRRGLLIRDATGTVHVEGLRIHGSDLSEGIQISAPLATVQLQNIHVANLRARDQVGFTDNHPDVVQTYGGVRELRIDRLTGSSDYQALFFSADFNGPHGPVSVRRTNLIGRPTARYLIWFGVEQGFGAVTLDDVWIDVPGERSLGISAAVWPDARADHGRRALVEVGYDGIRSASWPTLTNPTVSGRVFEGRPPDGDFAPFSAVGPGYASPGYHTPTAGNHAP